MVSKYNTNKKANKSFGHFKENNDNSNIWINDRLKDEISNDLMENDKKKNKYIDQMVDKFKFFSLRSPDVCFEIDENDLADETIRQKNICIQDCKTKEERNNKLNPIFTEVIARITEQAKPRILAGSSSDDTGLQRSLNEIRGLVSFKWILIGSDKKDILTPSSKIKNQKSDVYTTNYNKTETVSDIDNKRKYLFYKYTKDVALSEAILIKNHPVFLQIKNGKPTLSEIIDFDSQILIPPDKSNHLSKEYVFSSIEEIEEYIKRAEKETLDSLFKKVKNILEKIF